jgi:hypothetical protein
MLTIVVGKEAAQTPSRLSVRSSTPDATTYKKRYHKQVSKKYRNRMQIQDKHRGTSCHQLIRPTMQNKNAGRNQMNYLDYIQLQLTTIKSITEHN